jgi:hypothetical protein
MALRSIGFAATGSATNMNHQSEKDKTLSGQLYGRATACFVKSGCAPGGC